MTFKEIAKEIGDILRSVQFDFHLEMSGFFGTCHYDGSWEILGLLEAMWGLKDAPRASSMRLSRSLK
eukprot:1786056-Prorocentrum_lima.AAC.1